MVRMRGSKLSQRPASCTAGDNWQPVIAREPGPGRKEFGKGRHVGRDDDPAVLSGRAMQQCRQPCGVRIGEPVPELVGK